MSHIVTQLRTMNHFELRLFSETLKAKRELSETEKKLILKFEYERISLYAAKNMK